MMKGALSVQVEKKDAQGRKSIRSCENIDDVYLLGKELMPSCHAGMRVVRGVQKSTGMHVVIKMRAKQVSFRDKGEERNWRNTTEMLMNFPDSPAICRLYEVLEDKKAYYIIMEKVQGLDLFESLMGYGALTLQEVKDVMKQLLGALADLHSNGAIHKDLKLENVMIDRSSSLKCFNSPAVARSSSCSAHANAVSTPTVAVKLIDFDTVEEWSPKTPKAKNVLGTDQYISQEAYDGNYSPASDIFAAGVIGYKLLTGRFPFDNKIFDDEPGDNWVGSPKMKEIREKVMTHRIDWSHSNFQSDSHAENLLKAMLAPGVEERPSAWQALQHPWLQQPDVVPALSPGCCQAEVEEFDRASTEAPMSSRNASATAPSTLWPYSAPSTAGPSPLLPPGMSDLSCTPEEAGLGEVDIPNVGILPPNCVEDDLSGDGFSWT